MWIDLRRIIIVWDILDLDQTELGKIYRQYQLRSKRERERERELLKILLSIYEVKICVWSKSAHFAGIIIITWQVKYVKTNWSDKSWDSVCCGSTDRSTDSGRRCAHHRQKYDRYGNSIAYYATINMIINAHKACPYLAKHRKKKMITYHCAVNRSFLNKNIFIIAGGPNRSVSMKAQWPFSQRTEKNDGLAADSLHSLCLLFLPTVIIFWNSWNKIKKKFCKINSEKQTEGPSRQKRWCVRCHKCMRDNMLRMDGIERAQNLV